MELAWVFARNDERLTLRRTEREGYPTLIIDNGELREYRFDELPALVVFQSDMEQLLVQTGWTLAEFSPDRRAGIDRRGFPRIENDRRRWWTDARRPNNAKKGSGENAEPSAVQKPPSGSTRSE